MKAKYILDTSALLNDPESLFAFPKAEVIIPEVVLSELDRLKLTRADRSLIYRGREISRLLFSLSRKGKLAEGIKTENGSIIKVVSSDTLKEVPSSLNLKNTDDVILALTFQITKESPDEKVVLITSDLNMLLRAQSLELEVKRMEEKPFEQGFWAKLRESPRWRIGVILTTLFVILLIGVLAYLWIRSGGGERFPPGAVEFQEFKIREEGYKRVLQDNPRDLSALIGLGDLYFKNKRYAQAVIYYHRALQIDSDNAGVRTDMGAAYFYLGFVDIALREFEKSMATDPEYPPTHYFCGRAFEKKKLYKDALRQYQIYLELAPKGEFAKEVRRRIKRIKSRKIESK